jgi:Flp pilus assembly protein TadD
MKKASDILFLLATFSLRSGQISKAMTYARIGRELFPDDSRLIEMHAYALMLHEEYEQAEALLGSTNASTINLEFLRSRTAILLDLPKDERQRRLRRYLAF